MKSKREESQNIVFPWIKRALKSIDFVALPEKLCVCVCVFVRETEREDRDGEIADDVHVVS